MKCDMKMMLKTGLGLAVLIAVAYVAVPVAREWIVAASPFLFLLICPLMMVFMMKGMQSPHADNELNKDKSVQAPVLEAADTVESRRLLDHEKAL